MAEGPQLDGLIGNAIRSARNEKVLYKHLRDLPEHFLLELAENQNVVFKRVLDETSPEIAERIILGSALCADNLHFLLPFSGLSRVSA